MPSYTPRLVESKWQAYWLDHKTFRTADPGDPSVAGKPKYYILDMFPYPSGDGLHVGHPEGYTATDIIARYKRMTGHHVLHPIGWDAFGLPAEEYARKTGMHPRITTTKNINTFRRQIRSLGLSYDWDREIDTTSPDYFRWTQWIFLLLHDTWYDPELQQGRSISELPIPEFVQAMGATAVRDYVNGHRLAYQAEAVVNWCPAMGTVLANEEVTEGKSEIGGHPVERRPLRQWLLRITAYSERLLQELELVDWPESIKKMQRQWIGKSDGAEVIFPLAHRKDSLTVFTTRPDTLYGATYMVIAPEHPLIDDITTTDQQNAVRDYQQLSAAKSDLERTEQSKTGVFTGAYAINPVTNQPIPIWVADYVLGGYGTGAIMAVPAHDERDFAFAKTFDLPIVTVVEPEAAWLKKTNSTRENLTLAYTGDGLAINSGSLDGLATAVALETIITQLEADGTGRRRVNYKLRDWLFSRQRYWGEPFPLLHELDDSDQPTGAVRRLSVDDLPLQLPELEDFRPTGSPEGPLAKATDWVTLTLDGKRYRRETNTMPQWAGSCWYYLRYIDPQNHHNFADAAKLAHWLPVDLYVGGAEHAVLHLLYSRFWHKVLFDRGLVTTREPFKRLVNQGMILGNPEYSITDHVYRQFQDQLIQLGVEARPRSDDTGDSYTVTADGKKLPDDRTEKRKGKLYLKGSDIELVSRAEKMSKSRGNVVNPDDVVRDFGADSLRLYEMFMGPLEATKPWNTKDIEGVSRFLNRVWRLVVDDRVDVMALHPQLSLTSPGDDTLRMMHRTIRKVTEDIETLRFNTAISALMELTNHLTALPTRPRSVIENLVLLLSPFAPHIAEELWATLGPPPSVSAVAWPVCDPTFCTESLIEIPIQVAGKVKARLTVSPETGDAELERLALADPAVMVAMAGKPARMVKVVPGRLVNIVL